jgi:hypothetical protein
MKVMVLTYSVSQIYLSMEPFWNNGTPNIKAPDINDENVYDLDQNPNSRLNW